ncbi:hypothetical protein ACGFYZ_27860 [Streptomyces sp. NPDC048330]|uniref:hypothetical protein n=1 Tax=Streptomyces sp. NPDC048330 TaxID=3365533 RepID=UPI0037157FB7
MTVVLGERRRFAAEVGEGGQALRRVDLWIANEHLTCDDSMAYVPQFRLAVRNTVDRLRSATEFRPAVAEPSPQAAHRRFVLAAQDDDASTASYEVRRRHRDLDWGPTTDNAIVHLFREGGYLAVTLQFWRPDHLRTRPEHDGEVFLAKMPGTEFTGILDDLVTLLGDGPRDLS